MKNFALLSLAAACIFSAAPVALAHEVVYTATLSGAAESPPNASPGTGFTTVTVDLDLLTMRVEASFSGLIGNTTASHIHCCTAAAGVGNIGVATITPTFTAFPLGVTAGTYDRTYDMSLASSYSAGFITGNGGTVSTAFSALVAGLDAGKAYLNIHSSFAPGGEIRGFLAPVPEPTSLALMLVGVAALAGLAQRASQTGRATHPA